MAVDPTVWLVPVARLSNVVAVMPWECRGCEVLRRVSKFTTGEDAEVGG